MSKPYGVVVLAHTQDEASDLASRLAEVDPDDFFVAVSTHSTRAYWQVQGLRFRSVIIDSSAAKGEGYLEVLETLLRTAALLGLTEVADNLAWSIRRESEVGDE